MNLAERETLPLADAVARFRLELDQAVQFDSVKAIRDRAEALRGYAKSIGTAQSALNAIAEIKIRAERRMGRELASLAMHPGGRPSKTGDRESLVSLATLKELGIQKKASQRWQALARIPSGTFEAGIHAIKRSGEELSTAALHRTVRKLEEEYYPSNPAADQYSELRRQLRSLERAWLGASEPVRRLFVREHFGELAGATEPAATAVALLPSPIELSMGEPAAKLPAV